ncbi:MAG: hypothetical protein A2958_01635 [Candidatus Levybacteria bacterium RIFCSPLOWO2_01_FULL_38_13]|nr:MAG: hypothetical protein A2629_01435 [Candidatus Levybacteria bacterium RIFCSPHIGHO2_01_FULL_41_15]OGH34648.1 MAG: hypothetical protein A2958_01635 [Candidatus Levybacteria bacterium RIFCSPLOWO2_01_FULL_38_13]
MTEMEQRGSGNGFPIYFSLSEYEDVFKISPEIYNLQIERLNIARNTVSGLVDVHSEDEREFVKRTFSHLYELVLAQKIKKDPKKRPGWMPVCLYQYSSRFDKEEYWWGDEDEIGSSIVVVESHTDKTRIGIQKVIDALMPEAGITIFDKDNLFKRLNHLRDNGFSRYFHLQENHILSDTECSSRRCLAGEHYLSTIVPAVMLSIDVSKERDDPCVRMVSIAFSSSEY